MSTQDASFPSSDAGIDTTSLYSVIDKDNVHGLNLVVPESARKIIKPWDEREDDAQFADSGVDDQVVFHIPFTQNARVKSILLKIGRGDFAPRILKIYANHPNIVDFTDAESIKPQLDISLSGEVGVVEYPLRAAAFASITSLSLFFSDAVGEEQSRIYYIGFKGDLRSPNREVNSKLEVPTSNAADASLVDKASEKTKGQQTTAR